MFKEKPNIINVIDYIPDKIRQLSKGQRCIINVAFNNVWIRISSSLEKILFSFKFIFADPRSWKSSVM